MITPFLIADFRSQIEESISNLKIQSAI